VGLIVWQAWVSRSQALCWPRFAGFGRDKALKNSKFGLEASWGVIMTIIAGILSCGISFAFVYSQGPILTAMKANGAARCRPV